jgi:hypothetical protein
MLAFKARQCNILPASEDSRVSTKLCLLIAFALTGTGLLAQSQGAAQRSAPRVVGVWRAVESVDESGPVETTRRTHQPAIYIFTERHYSIQSINGAEPRPDVPRPVNPAAVTDADKLARYEHWARFTAHSGTYDLQGSRLTVTPIVAKNNNVMTPRGVERFDVAVEGDAIWLTNLGAKYRVKLVRLE